MSRFFFSCAVMGAVCGLVGGLIDSAGKGAIDAASTSAPANHHFTLEILMEFSLRSECPLGQARAYYRASSRAGEAEFGGPWRSVTPPPPAPARSRPVGRASLRYRRKSGPGRRLLQTPPVPARSCRNALWSWDDR